MKLVWAVSKQIKGDGFIEKHCSAVELLAEKYHDC